MEIAHDWDVEDNDENQNETETIIDSMFGLSKNNAANSVW